MSTPSKLKTPHDGAQAERDAFRAKVGRERERAVERALRYAAVNRFADAARFQAEERAWLTMEKWLSGRKARYSRRERGL